MEKLMKPAEYAKELGISRQAVYAKIKRGILTAKSVEGKLYIVVDNNSGKEHPKTETKTQVKTETGVKPSAQKTSAAASEKGTEIPKDYKVLLKAKDETISVLKDTVKDLKKSNKQISTTLRSEIDLLKEAFHEMRTLYVHRLEQKTSPEAIDVSTEEEILQREEVEWIGIKKFFKQQRITKEKLQEKIIKRLKKAFKSGDERLTKEKGKLKLNAAKSYGDIIN
jgi:small-conductance mechanosensitive channel